jgi:ketosteroid isomerase-like protein
MSQNVELIRQALDAFNRRDLDAYLALHDARVEFAPYERAVEGLGPYRGHDGIRAWWKDSLEAFPDLRAEFHDVRRRGNNTFARGRLYGTGAGSGAPFDRTIWLVDESRHGKIVWWRGCESEAEALNAARERG